MTHEAVDALCGGEGGCALDGGGWRGWWSGGFRLVEGVTLLGGEEQAAEIGLCGDGKSRSQAALTWYGMRQQAET